MDVEATITIKVKFRNLYNDEFETPKEAVEWYLSNDGEGISGLWDNDGVLVISIEAKELADA